MSRFRRCRCCPGMTSGIWAVDHFTFLALSRRAIMRTRPSR